MADVSMPQLGETVADGTVAKWFKAVGDDVAKGEPLFEVSTDKVDTEIPAPASGVLRAILVAEGVTVDVGTVLAVIQVEGEVPVATTAPAIGESLPKVRSRRPSERHEPTAVTRSSHRSFAACSKSTVSTRPT